MINDAQTADSTESFLRQYYVRNCGTEAFGTTEQLRAGVLDHEGNERVTSEAILRRLTRAWREMKRCEVGLPEAYRVKGEWLPIIQKAFGPLIIALDDENPLALDKLLRNFFRIFGDYFGEPVDVHSETNKRFRSARFKVYSSRWIELYGEASLSEVSSPLIGNPMGFMINEMLFTHVSFIHNHYARRLDDLCSDLENPVVCEIGGGWGGLAYHLVQRRLKCKYVDYDIPLVASIAAYYLLSAFPERRIGLFGEVADLTQPFRDHDIVVLPNYAIVHLQDQSSDVCFNQCSFAEMDELTVREYMKQFERICQKFIFHENHAWTSDGKNAGYQPLSGFKHWDISKVEPSRQRFKRIYKIPASFHSDFRAEFFEWLYARR